MMNEVLWRQYESKKMSAHEAVNVIRSGDMVHIGAGSSVAYALCDALGERAEELEGVTITCALVARPTRILSGKDPSAFRVCSYFIGKQERAFMHSHKDRFDFTSVHLSQAQIFIRETAPADVALLEVSPPDKNGYMSFGANGVSIHECAKDVAKTVILQVNKNAPYVYGEHNLIHVSEADIIVEADGELAEIPNIPVDDTINTISDYLLDQIPDGACIQLGIGGVANAVGYGLRSKNELGIHTEMMADSMMELMKLGVVTNSRKSFYPGKTVAAFTLGTKPLYAFIDHNPDMYYMPYYVVNDPYNIAKNDNMISINSAISIDILGQVNADNIGGQQHSATGGSIDFIRGAQMAKGGKSFIAIPSTIENARVGRASRIVSHFPVGTAVTTPRSDVQYVATEYGCVNLKPLTMRDRVRAMISLAHPDFRPQLLDDARMAELI